MNDPGTTTWLSALVVGLLGAVGTFILQIRDPSAAPHLRKEVKKLQRQLLAEEAYARSLEQQVVALGGKPARRRRGA